MDLMTNATFRILKELKPTTPYSPGIYRVILDEPRLDRTICILIYRDIDDEAPISIGRTRKRTDEPKRQRKKKPPPLIGKLIWMNRCELLRLADENLLLPISFEHAILAPRSDQRSEAQDRIIQAMSGFLDLKKLRDSILEHEGLGDLVKDAQNVHNVSRAWVYKQWSRLCRFGLHESSLTLQFDRCGAPGIRRPCDPPAEGLEARQKAGRKTVTQRVAAAYGEKLDPTQPGMTLEWAAAIRAADKRIPLPKPRWRKRYKEILSSAFCSRVKEDNGIVSLVRPEQGTYPNFAQIKRVLTVDQSRLERIIERTTERHFQSSRRGLVARNWQGVSGPGHTWAIDSTVADIYLRSSLNRAWIVGRPIVYIVVDTWSTAIVGFYVCLSGPKWDTAKVSLFNASADPALVSQMWGYQPILSLNPIPTLCYALLCDRGEYLSRKHRGTAMKLLPMTSYTPPYRGDLKGLVEVLHRIAKDEQFLFIPGAMDYCRKELELRGVNPRDCVFTIRDYVQYLYELFCDYNLNADRRYRLDAHMIADGVMPSPAGLWHWGHSVGIGFRQYQPEITLITELLPRSEGRVRRDAIRFAGCDYMSKEIQMEQWTEIARNLGGWNIPLNYYPGSMSSIWTPNIQHSDLIRLNVGDESRTSREVTFEELMDTFALATMRNADEQHQRYMDSLASLERIRAIRASAQAQTAEALATKSGVTPTMTEARIMELAASAHPSHSERKVTEELREEAFDIHNDMMAKLLASANDVEDERNAA